MTEIPREAVVKELEEQGHSKEEAESLIGEGTFHQVDESRVTVTGECDHYFEVDEPGMMLRHVQCEKCGLGRYTNKLIKDGRLSE